MGKPKKKGVVKRQKKEAREEKKQDSIDETIQRVVDAYSDSGAETPSQRDLGNPSGRTGPIISPDPSGNRDPLSQILGGLLENSPSIGDYDREDAVVDRADRTNFTVGVRSGMFVQNSIAGASKLVEKRNTNYDDENDSDDWCLSKYLNHRSDNEISDDDDGLEPSDNDEHHHHDLDLKSKGIPRSEKVEQKSTVKHENVKSQSR